MDISSIQWALSIALTVIMFVLGYMGWQQRTIIRDLDNTLSKEEIRLLIDDKLEALKVQHTQLDARLAKLEEKIDRILDHLSHNSK